MKKYQKNMRDIFGVLMEKGSPKLAIQYAKRIIEENKGKIPADIALVMKVYEFVEELARYLPEKMMDLFLQNCHLLKRWGGLI